MEGLPVLNFPPFRFRVSEYGGGWRVWDGLRGVWLVLTPEEWVRRHLINYLTEHCGVQKTLLRQECPVRVEGTSQRADVVVYGRDARPLLVAECKAPEIEIDAAVFAQVVRYNSVLDARYIVVTNGLKHFIHERCEDGRYKPLTEFPDLRQP